MGGGAPGAQHNVLIQMLPTPESDVYCLTAEDLEAWISDLNAMSLLRRRSVPSPHKPNDAPDGYVPALSSRVVDDNDEPLDGIAQAQSAAPGANNRRAQRGRA